MDPVHLGIAAVLVALPSRLTEFAVGASSN
jgi:hypothetical protein